MNEFMEDIGCSTTSEICPECGCEIEIPVDKLIDCPECGHKEVLPCSICKIGQYEPTKCNWNAYTRCTPFRKVI